MVHVKDASLAVNVVSNLISNNEAYIRSLKEDYEEVRQFQIQRKPKEYLRLDDARSNKLQLDWEAGPIYKPNQLGVHKLIDYPLSEIKEYIDWTFFFLTWGMKGHFPQILHDEHQGDAARKLYVEANEFLEEIIENKMIQANAVWGLWPANASGDDIILWKDENRSSEAGRFYHLRQQEKKKDGMANLCLSDYVAPLESGKIDYCGGFITTAGIGIEPYKEKYRKELNDYKAIMLEALADRLSEAFAELLHEKIRKEYWGYAPNEVLSQEDLQRLRYQGIRPALGYPACPEHSEKEVLFNLLNADEVGVTLTEHFAMYPNASVSGEYFAHPESKYFSLEKVGRDQVEDYAKRKGKTIEFVEKFLPSNLNYK